jgi:hypothetical protein
MSGIGGPGGIGGPKAPAGPDSVDLAPDLEAPDQLTSGQQVRAVEAPTGTEDIDRLAGEVAAGRLTPREAIDQLVEATATPDLSAAERDELRAILSDLVANDPYFGGLANRI